MEHNPILSRRRLWHPALPYALDYIGLVLLTAIISIFWFMRRLNSLYLAVPLGMAFTVLSGMIYYPWQRNRWQRRKMQLHRTALQLWMTDSFLQGTVDDLREQVCDLLLQQGYQLRQSGKYPLLHHDRHIYKLICLRRHPSAPADAQLLMQLSSAHFEGRIIVVSTAGFTDIAQNYAQKEKMKLICCTELAIFAQQAGMSVPTDCREHYFRLACRLQQKQRKSFWDRLKRTRTMRYLSGSFLLGSMGIFSPWRGWYWLAALYCLVMGIAHGLASKGKREDRS